MLYRYIFEYNFTLDFHLIKQNIFLSKHIEFDLIMLNYKNTL